MLQNDVIPATAVTSGIVISAMTEHQVWSLWLTGIALIVMALKLIWQIYHGIREAKEVERANIAAEELKRLELELERVRMEKGV